MGSRPHFILIDASAFIHRCYHGSPRLLRAGDHFPVGAIIGFSTTLWWQIYRAQNPEEEKPGTHIACVFDHKSPNFRHQLHPGYKSQRPPVDDDLKIQFPFCRRAATAFGVHPIEMEGHEADDIIATLTMKACRAGAEVTILSSDKDLMQLIGPMVRMYDPMKRAFIGEFEVYEKFGVYPDKMKDLQALVGDTADHIPGVEGVGPKTAAALLEEFGSLDELLARIPEVKQKAKREALERSVDTILLARKLVDLDFDVPLPFRMSDWTMPAPRRFPIVLFLKQMGCVELLEKVEGWFKRYG